MPPDYKKSQKNPDKEGPEVAGIFTKSSPFWKKLKHLRATFLQYADEKSIRGAWTDELKEDLETIESLEVDLNIQKRLLPGDMKLCNTLYKKYKVVYD
jgi:hypothetical protein